MLINHIVWDINPEIFSLGPFSIRYYGVLWALSFYLGYIIFERFVKKEHLPEGYLDKLTIYMLIGTVVGARLGHCLFYQPAYYLSNPIEILKIWEGGLASHGAAIGIILSLYLFSRKTKKPLIYILDRICHCGRSGRGSYPLGKPDEFRDIRRGNKTTLGIYI